MEYQLLQWYGISRQAAPGVLIGAEAPIAAERTIPDPKSDLSVAFPRNSTSVSGRLPVAVVIGDDVVTEILSWLHTYSAETFPVSQYCRVLTASEWATCDHFISPESLSTLQASAWASVIVGEMLGQGEYERDLSAVPLSRAGACFSYTMARSFFSSERALQARMEICQKRLRKIEVDGRFARRQIPVWALTPIWAALSTEKVAPQDLSSVVNEHIGLLSPELSALLSQNASLHSNSAEQRITGFDVAAEVMMNSIVKESMSNRVKSSAAVAGAALLAGRGTSHIELLAPYVKLVPESLAWYGLFAGLAGPRYWDPDWLRLVKGVERQLRLTSRLDEPVQSDLCWIEYDWLNQQGSREPFGGFPKNYPRLLSVEIVPGASCQFRLTPGGQNNAEVEQLSKAQQPAWPSAEQRNAVARAQVLVNEISAVLQNLSRAGHKVQEQAPLFEATSRLPKKAGRVKGAKGA
jgi:hypothetical protein